ncbi:MAG: hypothetical protein DCC67_09525 [Planctomycetota bacterium]|nr:MAG: hypothetical protein DCC67_09525 [Planctomycetota bacterium]
MSSGQPTSDDEDELELEPIDPEVLAHEQARAQARTDRALQGVDVDELYEDQPRPYSDLDVDWSRWRRFRFSTRHLLALTALLALALTLFHLFPSGLAWFLIAMATVASGYFWVYREETRIERERQRRREAFFSTQGAAHPSTDAAGRDEATRAPAPWFTFSLRQLFATMTAAAVIVGLIRIFGGAAPLAVILGTLALLGLVVQWAGYDPPPMVVLAWWFLLLAYLVVGVLATLSSQAAAAPMDGTIGGAMGGLMRGQ